MLDDHRIAEFLVSNQLMGSARVQQLRQHAAQHGRSLYRTVILAGDVEEQVLVGALARALGLRHAQLAGRSLDMRLLTVLPASMLDTYQVLPLGSGQENGRKVVFVAMLDPTDENTIATITQHLRRSIVPVLAGPFELEAAIGHCLHLAQATPSSTGSHAAPSPTGSHAAPVAAPTPSPELASYGALAPSPLGNGTTQAGFGVRHGGHSDDLFGGMLDGSARAAGVLELLDEPHVVGGFDDATPKSGLFQLSQAPQPIPLEQSFPGRGFRPGGSGRDLGGPSNRAEPRASRAITPHRPQRAISRDDVSPRLSASQLTGLGTAHPGVLGPALENASTDRLVRALITVLVQKGILTEDEIAEEL